MKIKQVYCPHCDEQVEWFDPDVALADITTLAGSLVGGLGVGMVGTGIALGGWPGVVLGLLLGGGMGRLAGRLFETDTTPCPGCCPGAPQPGLHQLAPAAEVETPPTACRGQVSGQILG